MAFNLYKIAPKDGRKSKVVSDQEINKLGLNNEQYNIEIVKTYNQVPLAILKAYTKEGETIYVPLWGGGETSDFRISIRGNLIYEGSMDESRQIWIDKIKKNQK
jgi:hypothetical protein